MNITASGFLWLVGVISNTQSNEEKGTLQANLHDLTSSFNPTSQNIFGKELTQVPSLEGLPSRWLDRYANGNNPTQGGNFQKGKIPRLRMLQMNARGNNRMRNFPGVKAGQRSNQLVNRKLWEDKKRMQEMKTANVIRNMQAWHSQVKQRFRPMGIPLQSRHLIQAANNKLQTLLREVHINPLKTWIYRDKFSTLADLGLTLSQFRKGFHPSSHTRLKKVMKRALEGKNITLWTLGGSNSAGGGIEVDENSVEGVFDNAIVQWWNQFADRTGIGRMIHKRVAIGGTGSDLFYYCLQAFLGNTLPDIVLIEESINDFLIFMDTEIPVSIPLEHLTRRLLALPSFPAVMFVALTSQFWPSGPGAKPMNPNCANLQEWGQADLAEYYDVELLSWRDVVCPFDPSRNRRVPLHIYNIHASDSHISLKAHAQVALMVIETLREGLLEYLSIFMTKPTTAKGELRCLVDDPICFQLRSPFFITRNEDEDLTPLCWTLMASNIRYPPKETLKVAVLKTRGFVMNPMKTLTRRLGPHMRTDGFSGLTAKVAGSYVILGFTIPGGVRPRERRSVALSYRKTGYGSQALAWLDNSSKNAVALNSRSYAGHTAIKNIALYVLPGYHSLHLQTTSSGNFIIVGVMVGAPGGGYVPVESAERKGSIG